MIRTLIIHLLQKWLHIHVCDEFTQWESYSLPEKTYDGYIGGRLIASTVIRWQERHCTLCGKIQQEKLAYYGNPD